MKAHNAAAINAEECLSAFSDGASQWGASFSGLLITMKSWQSARCGLAWKLKATEFGRRYFKLLPVRDPSTKKFKLIPTVTAMDFTDATIKMRSSQMKEGSLHSVTLSRALLMGLLPTPTTREYRGGRNPETLKRKGRKPTNTLGDMINSFTGKGSRLNAFFILEMMGFPVKWTLRPFQKLQYSKKIQVS